jgi:hypothetical protein
LEEGNKLPLNYNVHWLSKGNALKIFLNLKNSILKFSEEKGELPEDCRLLKNDKWLWDLPFLRYGTFNQPKCARKK